MNKWREETNLPYRSIPNNLCRSPLTRGWNTTPHSRCGLRVTLQWTMAEATSASWLRFTSTVIVMWTVDILDMLWWQGHLTFRVFLPKIHNPSLIMRKHQTILILLESRGILQHTWPVVLKKLSRSSKPRTVWETVTARRSLRRCGVTWWPDRDSWNRKRH